jgi:methylated-DNA-protein-cysteine methyltransferase-like protein
MAQGSSHQQPVKLDDEFCRRVYAEVAQVPAGWVCTYGTIAELAGFAGAARAVGWAMSRVPAGSSLPCHRIVNARGTLAPGAAFGGQGNQRALLEAEGVAFIDNSTIDMRRHRWPPQEDSQLALF